MIDELEVCGGINMGLVLIEVVLVLLVGCINVIGYKCVDKLGVDVGYLIIEIICEFDCCGVMFEEEIDVLFVVLW